MVTPLSESEVSYLCLCSNEVLKHDRMVNILQTFREEASKPTGYFAADTTARGTVNEVSMGCKGL